MMWWSSKNRPNEQWFETLVHQHIDELTAFAYRLCGNREQAEDLVQETFSEAWNGITRLKKVESARAWLFQVLRRRYARLIRSRQTSPELVQMGDTEENLLTTIPSRDPGPFSRAASSEYLEKMLSSLDARFRTPLLMATMEGLTVAEISNQLGVPVGTVLSRIHRARQSLHEIGLQLEQQGVLGSSRASARILEMDTIAHERKQHGS